jgi:hypothetical protein
MLPNAVIIGANAGLLLILKVNNGMEGDRLLKRQKEKGANNMTYQDIFAMLHLQTIGMCLLSVLPH